MAEKFSDIFYNGVNVLYILVYYDPGSIKFLVVSVLSYSPWLPKI